MNMKRRKRAGGSNPNRPRSKNNPDGKRKDPKIDWAAYNRRRKAEGADYDAKMKDLADKAREILGMAPGARGRRVSAILLSKLKAERKLPYWDLVTHLIKYPKDLERCELGRPRCHIMAPAPDI